MRNNIVVSLNLCSEETSSRVLIESTPLSVGVCLESHATDTLIMANSLSPYHLCRKQNSSHVPYITTPALLAIRGHSSAASFATGPVIAEPFISPLGLTMTPALSSKYKKIPSGRLHGLDCLTTTAGITVK